jgi:ribosomal protein L12E/L44/L45/RPP1/RPP2
MKYICAYLMVALAGEEPSKDSIKKTLESVGAEVNSDELNRVFALLNGKKPHELINAGIDKLATFSAPSAGAAAPATTTGGNDKKEPAKKKEEKPAEEEEVDLGGGGLFGDDDDF